MRHRDAKGYLVGIFCCDIVSHACSQLGLQESERLKGSKKAEKIKILLLYFILLLVELLFVMQHVRFGNMASIEVTLT